MIILYLLIVGAAAILLLKTKNYKKARLEQLDLKEHKLHKIYGSAMFLSDKILNSKLYAGHKYKRLSGGLTDKKLKALYVVENAEEIKYWFFVKKTAMALLLFMLFASLGLFVSLNESMNSNTAISTIERASPGAGESTVNISVEADGIKDENIELNLSERELTEEEIEALFEETYEKLLEMMPNEDESLDSVRTKVNLPDSIDLVRISWEFDDDVPVIDYDGSVIADFDNASEYLIGLTAVLEYGENHKAYQIPIRVIPQDLSLLERIQKSVQKFIEGEDKSKEEVELPTEAEGKPVRFTNVASHDGRYYIVLCILAVVLVHFLYKKNLDKRLKEREEEMLDDYPEIVSKLALLNEAGLTLLSAWFRVVADSEKAGCSERFAYKEMKLAYNKIKNGESEGHAYLDFGKRCNIHPFVKLGNLLEQNLLKGNAGLSRSLRLEAEQAVRDKKRRIREKGEKAGTKLLFPMILMMMVVVIIVIVPALMSMDL